MKQTGNKTAGAKGGTAGVFVRAFVVFASLASLCVSDGIGPRLVPFPSKPPRERVARTEIAGERRLSSARAEACAASDRLPKAVTPVWNDPSLGRTTLAPPGVQQPATPGRYNSPGYSFRVHSSTRGRAPPRAA